MTSAPGSTRTMTARSIVLSLVLGAPASGLAARDIVALAAAFDVSESATRVALSRMVAAGDLHGDAAVYRLTTRHRERQREQEAALNPGDKPFQGDWQVLVVDPGPRPAADRAALRRDLTALRFGELRDGVWTRPDNLHGAPAVPGVVAFVARPDDPDALVARLWDLPRWADSARRLLDRVDSAPGLRERFVAHAGIVRHLRDDPCLPFVLCPPDWPAGRLRAEYESFRRDLAALIPDAASEHLTHTEVTA